MKIFKLATLVASVSLNLVAAASASYQWQGGGGDNNWGTAANWQGDVAAVSGQALIFDGTYTTSNNNNSGTFIIGGLTFNAD
jgi:hypothetical protein